MSAPDRLAELRRQRGLMQEHLAWLDREIAAAEARDRPAPSQPAKTAPTASATPTAHPVVANDTASVTAASQNLEREADEIMAEYRVEPNRVQQDVRQGCLLYFVAALVLLVAVVVGLYFALRH